MWFRWLPWRFVVSRMARSHGFLDPIALLSRLHRFAQPSEVAEPVELLRAGVVFHARGLINARAIQHNLDWVWPYWVERQFDPLDDAFVPRAFSITHINLTHRNWTAVGVPGCDWLPIVDPRGLVTPLFDGWSIDAWIVPHDRSEPMLLPSRAEEVAQHLHVGKELSVETVARHRGASLRSVVDVVSESGGPACRIRVEARSGVPAWLAIALRPANPEGVSFVHDLAWQPDELALRVNDEASMHVDRTPDRVCMSHYRAGDVLRRLDESASTDTVTCDVGLATAACLFELSPDKPEQQVVRVPLVEARQDEPGVSARSIIRTQLPQPWAVALRGTCTLEVPDERMAFLFDAAIRSLVLHAPGEVYPGPYTYKRFWFRDAAFILDAMLAAGMETRVLRCLEHFPERQDGSGYFRSQEGEWDSNGAALWIIERYRRMTGRAIPDALIEAVRRGAAWIGRKRTRDDLDDAHAGLLPAGFSAEHLGPNDYYYWDDFFSVAGLESAAATLRAHGLADAATTAEHESAALRAAIDRSLERSAGTRDRPGIPASPYRRMDAGAIGSVVCGYPLRLWEPRDPRLLDTVEFLLEHCTVHGGFFQDMIHSGINAYLTLHLAQVLMRAGDRRGVDLMRTVADLASPTGQWPEAIHPRTRGGCMGDGQHIWAAAEWVLMMRNAFVRTEADHLVIGSGLPDEWLEGEQTLRLGPTLTPWGPLSLRITTTDDEVEVSWDAEWRDQPPRFEIDLSAFPKRTLDPEAVGERSITLSRADAPTPATEARR